MRKDNNTQTAPARPRPEPSFDEPFRRWSPLTITPDRACELVDLITRHDDSESRDALLQLICGLTPDMLSDDKYILDERFLAGQAALRHAFIDTKRAHNDLGAYAVHLRCAEWE